MLRYHVALRGNTMMQDWRHLLQVSSQRFCAFLLLALYVTRPLCAQEKQNPGGSWKFAVSGDSRNCGDIVMPAIAQGARRDGAGFYWHLGDYRLISNFDEDYRQIRPKDSISDY